MVGNDINSNIGWIKSATTEQEIPTDHTSWLYSATLGDPTLSDPTLKLKEDFDPWVARILSDIEITLDLDKDNDLIARFYNLNYKIIFNDWSVITVKNHLRISDHTVCQNN